MSAAKNAVPKELPDSLLDEKALEAEMSVPVHHEPGLVSERRGIAETLLL